MLALELVVSKPENNPVSGAPASLLKSVVLVIVGVTVEPVIARSISCIRA